MNDALTWTLAGLAGFALGAFFFGGLWWTTKRVLSSARPAAWLIGSMVLRMGIAVGGIYLVGGGRWQRILACLVGFMIARAVTTRLTRARDDRQAPPTPVLPPDQGGPHEPQP